MAKQRRLFCGPPAYAAVAFGLFIRLFRARAPRHSSPNLPRVAGASAVPGDVAVPGDFVVARAAAGVARARDAAGAEAIRDATGTRASTHVDSSAAPILR